MTDQEGRLRRSLVGFGLLFTLAVAAYFVYGFIARGVEAEMDRADAESTRSGKPFQHVRDQIQAASDRTLGNEETWRELRK